MSILAFMVESW